ncbi:MAG: Rieske 2Fe-2S domain-containing protein [Planctomycetes bacterium]|nr:Rieske 2Fe-2S domain-containing protein [Planctomycetota bacterium]
MIQDLQPAAQKTLFSATVRYGKMAYTGKFKTDRAELRRMDKCIVRTDRGREMGTVLTVPEPVPDATLPDSLGEILRKASADDVNNYARVDKEHRLREMETAKQFIRKLNLAMKVVEVDHLFGGERVVIYFMADGRVDFRELVRQLAHEFRTRIELKQIGARDQARLVGDVGHCGLDLCCRSHLKELGGITMDMAKIQKHTADPSKITGRCGKLLCCLRYEYVAYVEARDLLPPRGTRVQTLRGAGLVVDQNLLLREVTIIKEGTEERAIVKLDEIAGAPKSAPGCSGCGSPKAAGGTGPEEEEPPPTEAPVFRRVGRAADVPPGQGRVLDVEGFTVAVYNVGGRYYATQNRCPHAGGPLGEGELDGAVVTCPLHQWRFDVASGECTHQPVVKLKRYEVKVEGQDLYVKL